jgi:hypothetical protein
MAHFSMMSMFDALPEIPDTEAYTVHIIENVDILLELLGQNKIMLMELAWNYLAGRYTLEEIVDKGFPKWIGYKHLQELQALNILGPDKYPMVLTGINSRMKNFGYYFG